MDDLVAWYRAQLADDEEKARAHSQVNWLAPLQRRHVLLPNFDEPGMPGNPGRVLRDVAAKRQVLDAYAELNADRDRLTDAAKHVTWTLLGNVVRTLAAAVDDRPGYRDEWRP